MRALGKSYWLIERSNWRPVSKNTAAPGPHPVLTIRAAFKDMEACKFMLAEKVMCCPSHGSILKPVTEALFIFLGDPLTE